LPRDGLDLRARQLVADDLIIDPDIVADGEHHAVRFEFALAMVHCIPAIAQARHAAYVPTPAVEGAVPVLGDCEGARLGAVADPAQILLVPAPNVARDDVFLRRSRTARQRQRSRQREPNKIALMTPPKLPAKLRPATHAGRVIQPKNMALGKSS
jgi:hypothetical protein